MTHDKQLREISLDEVVEKRRLDQALNAKEFAVLAGISYSAARAWFRLPGFPVVCGMVFWQDFVEWRRERSAPISPERHEVEKAHPRSPTALERTSNLPSRAQRLLSQAG